ncbi:MAG: endonuclease III [Calditerrivibrio sp.]|nr:endonuclease III [Calditerrivibrio sp.]
MKHDFEHIFSVLEREYNLLPTPSVTQIANLTKNDPFLVMISTVISLRTKDEITLKASKNLFKVADTPYKMSELIPEEIGKLIFPAGFYKKKGETIHNISKYIVDKYCGKVPDNIEELLKIKGVGRKTANLVMVEGFKSDAICVDTHVHRIMNRMGIVNTKNPNETEMELRKILPKRYWKRWNEILVSYGQHICRPISPFCSSCNLYRFCDKVGVNNWR